jgi:hypothetical protein
VVPPLSVEPGCAAGDVVTECPGKLVAATRAKTPVNAVAPTAE